MLYRQIDRLVFPKRIALANAFGPPVLVWTMTKVGTTSIARSLQTKLGKYRVFGEHNINDLDWPRSITLYDEFIVKQKPVKIITAVRDPISQSVSNFFHKYNFYTGDCVENPRLSTDEMMRKFLSTEIDISWKSWFEDNLERYLDIDIYSYPFPVEKGCLTLKKGSAEILLLKTEMENSLKENAIEEFLSISNFKIKNRNVGDSKSYSQTYKKFKEEVRFPHEYLNFIRSSKYINHFYSDSEKDLILSRWTPN